MQLETVRLVFEKDMRETLIELDYIVEWNVKYGEPQARRPRAVKAAAIAADVPAEAKSLAEREWPQKDKLTLHWLYKNMPASAWLWLALFVAGAFAAGTTLGAWPVLQKRLEVPANHPVVTPAKAASE